jgi:hypothetical protein
MTIDDGINEHRLAVENALASAFADVDNDFIGWSSLKNLMSTVFPDHAELRWWYNTFREFQGNGGDNSLPFHAPWFEKLRDELRIMLNHRVNMSDDLTRISAMNWKKRLWQQYGDFNTKVFMKPMLRHNGIMYHIWGVPGSGKTDFALLQVETALEMGFTVITNIYSLDAQLIRFGKDVPSKRETRPNFYRTVRMSDLLYKMVLETKQKHDIIIVWDEISAWMHKQNAASKFNIDFSRLIRLIRKFNGNIFFLEQIDEGLSSVANEMLAVKFHKESQKKVHYTTRFEERNYNLYLESVPRTSLHFKTSDFAGFVNDIDFKEMFSEIAFEDQGDKLMEIQMYLEALESIIATSSGKKKMKKRKGKN